MFFTQINSNIEIHYCNDTNDTILNIILKHKSNRAFCFRRITPTNDAPHTESWDYVYIAIPFGISDKSYMVFAIRYYSMEKLYQRCINPNGEWYAPWHEFTGSYVES